MLRSCYALCYPQKLLRPDPLPASPAGLCGFGNLRPVGVRPVPPAEEYRVLEGAVLGYALGLGAPCDCRKLMVREEAACF